MRANRNAELSVSTRLQLILRYKAIKAGVASETLQDLCKEFNVNRHTPCTLFKRADSGEILSRKRTGRPSLLSKQTIVACVETFV